MLKRSTKQTAMRKRWAKKANNDLLSLSSLPPLAPPVYKSHSYVTEHHGCRRNDDFYWLSDRSNKRVKQLLKAENRYMERFFTLADNTKLLSSSSSSPLSSSSSPSLRRKLFKEMASRIRSNDISLPSRERSYWYYSRYVEHEEHPLLCRRPYCALHSININFANEVSALWESDPNALLPFYDDEEIYLDLNLLKEQLHLDHIDIGEIDISHDEQQLVMTVDWSSGKEVFAVVVMNMGHVDYASWLKQHAHPLHRAWAERQFNAGQSIYGSPTKRSPLFTSLANAPWQRSAAPNTNCEESSDQTTHDERNNEKVNTINETEALKIREKEDDDDDNNYVCEDVSAEKHCTQFNSSNSSNSCGSSSCKRQQKKIMHGNVNAQQGQDQNCAKFSSTTSNLQRLPFHDIVCVVDDVAVGDEVMWADEMHVLFFTLDDKMRPYQLIYHTLPQHKKQIPHQYASVQEETTNKINKNSGNTNNIGCSIEITDICDEYKVNSDVNELSVIEEFSSDDIVCYEEDDEAFWLGGLTRTADEQYCMFTSSSSERSECYVCPTTLAKENAHTNNQYSCTESCQLCSCHKCKEHVAECQTRRRQLTDAPRVRAVATHDKSIDSEQELTCKNEQFVIHPSGEQVNNCEEEPSTLSCSIYKNIAEFRESWKKSGEMICFAPRQGSEGHPLEYEIDHHPCLLAEPTHNSSTGAWVIVSNAQKCTNHAVFIVPDDDINPCMQEHVVSNMENVNRNTDKAHNSSSNNSSNGACNLSDVKSKTYFSLTSSAQWRLLFTYDEAIKVEHVELSRNFLLISVRKQGNPTVLFCPIRIIHNWWQEQKKLRDDMASKCTRAIPISTLTDLQDIIVKSAPLRASRSSSQRSMQEWTTHKLAKVNVSELYESTNVNDDMQRQCTRTNNNDDDLTFALESINLSNGLHRYHEQQQNHNELAQLNGQTTSSSISSKTSLQRHPHLTSLPYNVEAMGFTSSFHSDEFRILVTHMLEPLTYYHAAYCKDDLKFNKSCGGSNSNASAKLTVNVLNDTFADKGVKDANQDGVLRVTRMCQEIVVSAPGEPAYNVEDYDGAVVWVPSNYAYEHSSAIGKVKKVMLKPLPTLEPANVVEIPVFMCWKRSSTQHVKPKELKVQLEGLQEKEHEQKQQQQQLIEEQSHETECHMSVEFSRESLSCLADRDVLLRVYGSYGDCIDPCFNSERLTLLHRGFIVAAAAVRGGGEFGMNWRDAGRKLQRATTVNDLISVSQFINDYQHFKYEELFREHEKEDKEGHDTCNAMRESWKCSENLSCAHNDKHQVEEETHENTNDKAHLIISGDSAGGFVVMRAAIAAPMNFHAVIAAVPFVDCLTTLLDDALPLTITEWEEFGNPLENKVSYDSIAMLSPYEVAADMNAILAFVKDTYGTVKEVNEECGYCCDGSDNANSGTENNNDSQGINNSHDVNRVGDASSVINRESDVINNLTLPHIFMLTDWNDSRVGYWESLKLTAKLRSCIDAYKHALTTQDIVDAALPSCTRRILLHHCELDEYDAGNHYNKTNCCSSNSGGHCGPTGRYEELHELAREYAFALIVCGKC